MTPTRIIVISAIVIAVLLSGWYGVSSALKAANAITVHRLPNGVLNAQLVKKDDGQIAYRIQLQDGTKDYMDPQEYAQVIYAEHDARTFTNHMLVKMLNISSTTSIGWIVLGLLGQLLFAGRMVVQWIVSEKQRRSVVPTAFWWLALSGASMLLVYFIWRKDLVGILGQGTGWLIYTRNLYFIYVKTPNDSAENAALVD